MFRVDAKTKSFVEVESLRLCIDENEEINYSEFDINFEHIFILKNLDVLEKRSLCTANKVMMNIKLEEKVKDDDSKQLSLSNDGTFCVIGAMSLHI